MFRLLSKSGQFFFKNYFKYSIREINTLIQNRDNKKWDSEHKYFLDLRLSLRKQQFHTFRFKTSNFYQGACTSQA